uniref:Uncharacterized protein n=1 Tax=Arundo donax TaxID=35708 RepID=A0A0A8ZQ00_ARUDO
MEDELNVWGSIWSCCVVLG